MPISHTNKPQIFITMGDPAGVGPEVIMKSMASPDIMELAIFTIVADAEVIKKASEGLFPGKFTVHQGVGLDEKIDLDEGSVNVLDPGPPLKEASPGKATVDGAKKALECIKAAAMIMQDPGCKTPRAMVTAPVSKEAIARVHEGFIGHTEYLQEACSARLVTMVLTGEKLCVVPVTRHIPLSEVSGALTTELIVDTLRQVVEGRKLLSKNDPARIGVSALNPHCGESGKIGTEEIDIIAPAVEKAKNFYEHIEGPVSGDTIFYRALKKKIDIVVSMYHDQCLAPFKMVEFNSGVNVTLGLGWVRTSPDHGTAFDIAGKNLADPGSMKQAIKLASRAISGN
ncbi:MAG: 4-hydroxythreonine-4-phosphate dehydrogenase PdxA [Candidatus Omnitrophota bacterium]